MNYYLLSADESHGGVKAAFGLATALNACGSRCLVVTPDGRAPQWLRSSVAVAAESDIRPRLSAADVVIFSAAHERERLAALPARLVFHCLSVAATPARIEADATTTVLRSWPPIPAQVGAGGGRRPIEIGIAVSDAYFHAGQRKLAATVAVVPGRGLPSVADCAAAVPSLRFVAIDGLDEGAAAAALQTSEYCLIGSPAEDRGLEVLEGQAAGCVVMAMPHAAGLPHLVDGVTGIAVREADLSDSLRAWSAERKRLDRAALVDRGRAVAAAHRPACMRRTMAALLAGPLAFMRP